MGTILFELNEVPWRVMDWFCDRHPRSAFARIRDKGRHYEAHAEDRGELHPWVTWPSLHRGAANDRHGIGHLGQDLREVDAALPTVWELLRRSGQRIGIAGSLHSYPVPRETRDVAFYVPDTFASGPETIPGSLSPFQDASLRLTRENGRNVKRKIDARTSAALLASLPRIGVAPASVMEIGGQLLRERADKTKLNRRRAMQALLYFDVFLAQLRKSKPNFATYFTNHVAAAMHRFWAASFPDDYAEFSLGAPWAASYRDEIEWAMTLADGFAGRLIAFCERNPGYRMLVCSSMGQAATSAEARCGSQQIRNVDRFMSALGIERGEYRQATAMAPDVSIHLLTERARERIRAAMPAIVAATGGEWDLDERDMLHASIRIEHSPEYPLPEVTIGNRLYALGELGFEFVEDQDGVGLTAYHVPEGIVMAWDPADEREAAWTRPSIGALEIAPALLRAHGVTPPEYMRKSSLAFA